MGEGSNVVPVVAVLLLVTTLLFAAAAVPSLAAYAPGGGLDGIEERPSVSGAGSGADGAGGSGGFLSDGPPLGLDIP